jgi:hypothetical protein
VLATNCPHWILGAAAGFAGPILGLIGLDTCGANLSGLSTSGKTFAQKLAVSAWTSPRIGIGLLQSLRTTENAVESLAQAGSGTVLALDEVAHADGKMLGRMIYSIAGGLGNLRVNNRESVGWYDDDVVYIPTRTIREAAGNALKEQEIARILDQRGLLAEHETGRLTIRYVPRVGHVQCYALLRRVFGRSDRVKEPELTVHEGGRQ